MTKWLLDLFLRRTSAREVLALDEQRTPSYDELFKDDTDGTARYDDVWGAPCEREDLDQPR